MAFLIDGANTLDDGDLITNSLRFNGSNAYLNRTTSTASGNTKLTISYWTKGHSTGSSDVNYHFVKFDDVNNRIYLGMWDREIRFYQTTSGSATFYYRTQSNTFADPSAWYHFCLIVDTTDGTAGDRIQLYVNGTRYTDWQTETQPSQNATLRFATDTSTALHIGRYADSTDYYFDGYMAEIHYIDGQNKAASDFGETNDNGVWVPKEYTGTYGDEGFYLQFKETGTSANASGIGADTSGNGNHMTVADLTSVDTCVDTPTNNFCVWNGVDYSGDTALAEGNTEGFASSADDYHQGARGSIAVSSGKWYWEVKAVEVGDTSNIVFAGIISADHSFRKDKEDELLVGTYGMRSSNGNSVISNGSALAYATYGAAFVDGDILNLALDMDNNRLYIGKGGSWADGSGNIDESSINSYLSLSTTPSAYMPMVIGYSTGAAIKYQANFGNAPHSISSGNADANGYGNFEYAVPSGFYALCTKNLAEYG